MVPLLLTLEEHLQHGQSQQPLQSITLESSIHCDLFFEIAPSFAALSFAFLLTFPVPIFIFAE